MSPVRDVSTAAVHKAAVRRYRRAALVLALWIATLGFIAVTVALAIGVFFLALGPFAVVLLIGFYLVWRREKRLKLFCPTCGRRYGPEDAPFCRFDRTKLRRLS